MVSSFDLSVVCQSLFVFIDVSFQHINVMKYSGFKDPNVFISCKLYEGNVITSSVMGY